MDFDLTEEMRMLKDMSYKFALNELTPIARQCDSEEKYDRDSVRKAAEIGLVAAWWGPQGALIDNDEVAAFVRAQPHRLRGLASVDLFRPMAAVRELRRCVRQLGFRGLRIVPWLWGLPPDDRRYYPLYAECIELDVPFCLQVGHTGPPWTQEIISLATKCANVHIDTSAYKATRFPVDFVEFMRGRGMKKVMFGTNYPMLTAALCLEGLATLGLSEEGRALYLSGNARRVFKVDDE